MQSGGYSAYLLKYRYRIAITYAFAAAGSGATFAYPYLTGVAIDGALQRRAADLLPLVAVWFVHLLLEGFRQVYDTRTFTKLFADTASNLIERQRNHGLATSEVAARVHMVEEVTWFLGSTFPEIIISIVTPVGSLAVLFLTSSKTVLYLVSLAAFTVLLVAKLFKTLQRQQATLNELQEQSVGFIDRVLGADRHYEAIGRAFVQISDLNALTWVSVQVLGVVALALSVWAIAETPSISAGEAYAAVAYLWRALDGVFFIPSLAHQLARLRDIWGRIHLI